MKNKSRFHTTLATSAGLIASALLASGCQSSDDNAPGTGIGSDSSADSEGNVGSGAEAGSDGARGGIPGDAGTSADTGIGADTGKGGSDDAGTSGDSGGSDGAMGGGQSDGSTTNDAAPFDASARDSASDGAGVMDTAPYEASAEDGTIEGGGTTDAVSPEASGPSADAAAPYSPIESIDVPGSTGLAVSKTSLDNGELFLLRANGSVDVGGTAIDAEFGGFSGTQPGTDTVGGVDVGVDFGLKTVRLAVPLVPGRMKWFGAYRSDHVYYMIVNGAGNPLSLKLLAPATTGGTGTITVSLYRLSPTLQPVGTLVDTVAAPVTLTPARTAISTSENTIYLLRCAGQATVGGNGLGMGDADWMDYAANGSGQEDIGDANTDYGLGVDEPFVGAANTNTPRKRWWGLWRADHTYYMLFTGTGNSIEFNYYDSGYGDNSTTVTLSVGVRALD